MGAVSWHRFGSATPLTLQSMTPSLHFKDVIFWSLLIFAFGGSEAGSFMGEEIKNPRRTVALALFLARSHRGGLLHPGTDRVLVAVPSSQVGNLSGLMQAISDRWPHWVRISCSLRCVSHCAEQRRRRRRLSGGDRAAAVSSPASTIACRRPLARCIPRWKTPWMALLVSLFSARLFIFLDRPAPALRAPTMSWSA